jgi:thiol-disulfide isomerase/thioredoxin
MSVERPIHAEHQGQAFVRRSILVLYLLLVALPVVHAQNDEPEERQPDPLAIMRSADEAIGRLDSLALNVHSRGIGTLATRSPETHGDVLLRRASGRDPLGWAFHIEGTARHGEDTRRLLTAYDGRGVRSIREHEEAVIESPWEHSADPMSDGAGWSLIWLVRWGELVSRPFGGEGRPWRARYEGVAEVDGTVCDVVNVDYSETPDPNLFSAWWFIGRDDSLPRRVDLHMVDHRHGDGFLLITLSGLRPDAPVDSDLFTLATPEGFELRAAERPAVSTSRRGRPTGVPFGEIAPDWTLEDPTGREHSLSDYRGKVVVMHFWATWCPPCRRAMPGLQALHEKHKDRGLVVFGVNSWESGDPVAHMDAEGYKYTLLLDGDAVAGLYSVSALPTIYVISPEGRIAHHAVGGSAGLEDVIDALLP